MHRKVAGITLGLLTLFALRTAAQSNPQRAPKTETNQPASSPAANQPTIETRVEKYLRNLYAWGPAYEVKVGPIKPSPVSDLLEVQVAVSMAGQGDTAIVYVSKSGTFLIRGELSNMTADPLSDIRAKLHAGASPSMGPENAKVTLIEFADFECPSCRQLDLLLRDFLPKHPGVRLVFKNFPLTQIHPWAMSAAIAGQCVYQQNTTAFWKMHDAIYDAQDMITPSNATEKLADMVSKTGLNMETFRTCMDNPETSHQVEQNMEEGRALNLTGTPTTFINGRRLVGADEPLLEQYIQYEEEIK